MSMRTIRAMIPIALMWGIAWAMIGVVFVLVLEGIRRWPLDLTGLLGLFALTPTPIVILGCAGMLAGAVFGATLSRAEQGKSLDTLSVKRTAAWGALGGFAFSLAGLTLISSLFGIQEALTEMAFIWLGVATVSGAGSAAASLAIARKGRPGVLEEAVELSRIGGG